MPSEVPASDCPFGTASNPDLNISAINGLSHIHNAIMPATNAVNFLPKRTGNP